MHMNGSARADDGLQKTYEGRIDAKETIVLVHSSLGKRKLDPRIDLKTISIGSFAWGHGGKRVAQLAFAIAYDALSGYEQPKSKEGAATRMQLSELVYDTLKWRIFSVINDKSGWLISQSVILGQIQGILEANSEDGIKSDE